MTEDVSLLPLANRLLEAIGWPASARGPWPAGIVAALMMLVATVIAAWLMRNVIATTVRRLAARTATDIDDQIVDLAEKPTFRLVEIIGVYLAARELPFPHSIEVALTGILLIGVVLVGMRVATKI